MGLLFGIRGHDAQLDVLRSIEVRIVECQGEQQCVLLEQGDPGVGEEVWTGTGDGQAPGYPARTQQRNGGDALLEVDAPGWKMLRVLADALYGRYVVHRDGVPGQGLCP